MENDRDWKRGKLVLLSSGVKPLCVLGCQPSATTSKNSRNQTKTRQPKRIYLSSKVESTV